MSAAAAEATGVVRPAPSTSRRIRGVDVARGVALLAMMTVHVLPELGPDGRVQPWSVVASGRASALFATLAGVGLALATGGDRPRLRPWPATAAGVLVRAVLVAGVGMALVSLDPPVAVILTNYGLLFAVALPFLALRPKPLLLLATAWVLLAPLVSHALRRGRAPGPGGQPSFAGLADPGDLLERLLLTGYYPVLTWTAYVLVGLAVGRLALARRDVATSLLTGGLAVALLSGGASVLLVGAVAWKRVVAAGPAEDVLAFLGPEQLQLRGRYGTTPTTTWWWETVVTPHSGTVADLAQTLGCALAVLGLALLAVRAVDGWRPRGALLRSLALLGRGAVAGLASVGSMTLTLYSLHVVATAAQVDVQDRPRLLLAQVAVVVVLASAWRALAARGPLEQLVSWASRSAQTLVAGGRRH